MKHITIVAMTVLTTTALSANPAKQPMNHVPERLDSVRLIQPAAEKSNHILIVNVANAIPESMWQTVVTYAVSKLQLNTWTNSVSGFTAADYVADPARVQKTFGDKAKVAVFMVDDPQAPRYLGAPGHWYAVNVNGLKDGATDDQTVKDRYAKMILKGMAYVSGGGSSLDSNCSLYFGSFDMDGIDGTKIQIAPTTYFPMLEVLKKIGGMEMLTPAIGD